MIVVINNNNKAQKEREHFENELGKDILLNLTIVEDKSFVILSGMTTDEAIIIKKGIIKRIQQEYGSNFTTSEAVVVKDSAILRMEQQKQAEYDRKFQAFINKYIFMPFITFMCILVLFFTKQ